MHEKANNRVNALHLSRSQSNVNQADLLPPSFHVCEVQHLHAVTPHNYTLYRP